MSAELPILISAVQLSQRVREIAQALTRTVHTESARPLYIAVLEGASVFADQLLPLLPGQPQAHGIAVSSYARGITSSGTPVITESEAIPVYDRDLVILEDIVDTGLTAQQLMTHFSRQEARSIRLVSMLAKPSRRQIDIPIEYWGFEIPDHFVVGYGMDFEGEYRELPEVRILSPNPSHAADGAPAGPTR